MHRVKIDENHIRTDLIIELDSNNSNEIYKYKDVSVYRNTINNYSYTTISFLDITDSDSYFDIEKIFIKELKKYININNNDVILVVGLGNDKSTPDALGPLVIENILVTRYLYLIGDIDKNFSNVSKFIPNVMGNTGIDSISLIKNVIKDINASLVIVIDSLKAGCVDRLIKTIQITDSGIHPGSGINNDRGELSSNVLSCPVISIGVPTVVDVKTIVEDLIDQEVIMKDNYILTPTNIDFVIERLSTLIGRGINICLHKDFIRQIY